LATVRSASPTPRCPSALPWPQAAIARSDRPVLVVATRADRADALAGALAEYLPGDRQPLVWTAPDALPFEQLPFDLEASTRRITLLDLLRRWRDVPSDEGAPPVVVASVHGLLHLLMSPKDLAEQSRTIRVGSRLDVERLLTWAVSLGYQTAPLVQEPGTIARRGGILDIFPPGAAQPLRIDLFGDEVETIRRFDPSTQRSVERMAAATLLPPSELPLWRLPAIAPLLAALDRSSLREEVRGEWDRMLDQIAVCATPASVDLFAPYLLDAPTTLVDYLPQDGLVVVDEPGAVDLAARQLEAQAGELEAAFVGNGELPPGLRCPIAEWGRVSPALRRPRALFFGGSVDAAEAGVVALDDVTDPPRHLGRLGELIDDVAARLREGWRVVVATDQVERLTELFEEQDIFPRSEKRRAAAQAVVTPPPPAPWRFATRAAAAVGPCPPPSCSSCPIWRCSASASRAAITGAVLAARPASSPA
jgi:transcription-repair coupling factor (superfamily II helicase)